VIVRVVVVAQTLAAGVNVYVVVNWLLRAGDQLPVMAFVDVVGKAFKADPAQMAATELNVGVMFGLTKSTPFTFVVPFQNPPPAALYPPYDTHPFNVYRKA
jgi:hypothetical protein